jgi:ParB-like chromosome segregation protein Spo0J
MTSKLKIENVAVDTLIPYARNSRTHDDAQVAQIAASIKEFGFTNPVLIDADGGVIAGHGRILAARKLKLAEVPCIRLSHLTETQKRAYVIADNKLALNAGWDSEILESELQALHADSFTMGLLGFDVQELGMAMGIELDAPESSSKEIDTDDYNMGCKCPKCGFEFDAK